jgi:hypothetical protein
LDTRTDSLREAADTVTLPACTCSASSGDASRTKMASWIVRDETPAARAAVSRDFD